MRSEGCSEVSRGHSSWEKKQRRAESFNNKEQTVKFEKCGAIEREAVKSDSHYTSGKDRIKAASTEESQSQTAQEQKRVLKTDRLMERIVAPYNMQQACKRVMQNKGAPGIDNMPTKALPAWLKIHREELSRQLIAGTYKPSPVKRVIIPKPDGGVRNLGIPTVIDRVIQQATLQILNEVIDPTFSTSSYGFRPGKSAHQALEQASEYVKEGFWIVVDIDLEKFFDRVNHDVLMSKVAYRIGDKSVLKLIRAYLNAGIMANGVCIMQEEGTPQGGPLSPLLANILLDELDKELEKRKHKFCRYADDCNIYVGSQAAGERVMASVSKFLEERLRLKVNKTKSAVGPSSYSQIPGLQTLNEWHLLYSQAKHQTL